MSDHTTATSLTLESLYSTYHGWLKSWMMRKLQSVFDADDIAQDTFLRVMGSDSLSTIRDPRSFLCTIAKRVMVDLFRRNALEKSYLEMVALMPEELAPSPEERESQLETLQLIDTMLDGLNAKTREAFLLSQLEGLAYSEIAHTLGVSVSSVKKYIAKAIEHCLLFRLEHGLDSFTYRLPSSGTALGIVLVCGIKRRTCQPTTGSTLAAVV